MQVDGIVTLALVCLHSLPWLRDITLSSNAGIHEEKQERGNGEYTSEQEMGNNTTQLYFM